MYKEKFLILLLSVLLSFSLLAGFTVNAESVPYNSYTYWEGNGEKHPVETKAVFLPQNAINAVTLGVNSLNQIEDIYAFEDTLYILDNLNGKILLLNRKLELIGEVKNISHNGKTIDFSGAKGVFVDKSGIYIADTENKRILITDGKTVNDIVTCPETDAIPENFVFEPVTIFRDSNGYLYVLSEGSYYGIMLFSDKMEFLGFYGSDKVKVNAADAITDFIASLFETDEKHSASIQALPFQLIDFCIDSEGFVTAISDQSKGQIKRFGTKGTNILTHSNQFSADNADSYNFADYPVAYQDKTTAFGTWLVEKYSSIACDSDGYIYAVDGTQGKIFMYDTQCQLITVFGGGVSKGNQHGTFITPNAITCFGDKLLVSDFRTGEITVFAMTKYGETLKQANTLTNKSLYLEAKPYWQEIYNQDKNCQLAYKGLANAALEEKDYSTAMSLAKAGVDRVAYAAAFKEVRNTFIQRNFVWIGILAVTLLSSVVYFITFTRKRNVVIIKNRYMRTALTACIHPFRSFNDIKQNGILSVPVATVIMLLYYVATVVGELSGGFMYVSVDAASFNAVYTLLGTVGVVLLFSIMNWAVSTLFSGRGTIKECYCTTCYCLIPMIVYELLFLLLSHTVIATSNSSFGTLTLVFQLYTIILILISMTVIHDFSFFKSMAIAIIIVLGMCIAAFIIFIMLSLGQDAVSFIVGIIKEISLR